MMEEKIGKGNGLYKNFRISRNTIRREAIMGKSETMKKQIKDILGMVWKYNRILGGIKLLNAVLLAVLVPINTILFQKIIDDILILLRHKRITTGIYVDFGLFVAALFLDVLLTSFDNYIEIRFDMRMTDGLERISYRNIKIWTIVVMKKVQLTISFQGFQKSGRKDKDNLLEDS